MSYAAQKVTTRRFGIVACIRRVGTFVDAVLLNSNVAVLHGEMTAATYGQLMPAWLVVVVILFGAPLLAFSGLLRRLKETTLLTASLVATRRERTAERELLGSNMSAAADAEASASGDMSDPSNLCATAKKLSIFLISRARSCRSLPPPSCPRSPPAPPSCRSASCSRSHAGSSCYDR